MEATRTGWVKHAVALTLIIGFLAMGWWQAQRALAGNTLSWAYTFEWPVFAAFVGLIWWRETRQPAAEPTPEPTPPPRQQPVAPVIAAGDSEVSEYNMMLAWLAEHPDAHPADYQRKHS